MAVASVVVAESLVVVKHQTRTSAYSSRCSKRYRRQVRLRTHRYFAVVVVAAAAATDASTFVLAAVIVDAAALVE